MSASTTEIPFEKWRACGNDFLVIQASPLNIISYLKLAAKNAYNLCTQRETPAKKDTKDTSGADGIAIYCTDKKFIAWVINKDGSFAENCGNALRCLAMSYASNAQSKELRITLGQKTVTCKIQQDSPPLISTDMGKVQLDQDLEWYDLLKRVILREAARLGIAHISPQDISACDVGNKHAIIFSSAITTENLQKLGRNLQIFSHKKDRGINLHVSWQTGKFYEALSYERGVGLTLSCGSGAAAIAASVMQRRMSQDKQLQIKMPGGILSVSKTPTSGRIIVSGGAERLSSGSLSFT